MLSVRRDVRSAGDGQDGLAEAYRSTARNEQSHRRGRNGGKGSGRKADIPDNAHWLALTGRLICFIFAAHVPGFFMALCGKGF